MDSKRIVVGMSGGVDSTMALILLKKQGWKPVGLSLKFPAWKGGCKAENACCTEESLRIAEKVCENLGVPYQVFDVGKEFERVVIDSFVADLKSGLTPNPCAICNRELKFTKLFEWGKRHGIDYVATGHYARSRLNPETGKGELLRPKDKPKDQTYGMCMLSGEMLSRIVFPLGELTKKQVFKLAKEEGLEFFARRRQSQDLCFVARRDLRKFIAEKAGRKPGRIVDSQGRFMGRHDGLHFYTVGQRRGLGLPQMHFVKKLDREDNTLIITKDREELLSSTATVTDYSFISGEEPEEAVEVLAQTRSHQAPAKAVMHPPKAGRIRLEFMEPVEAVTPGQACAFYSGDLCLGGGILV
jgi:tRNA-specific 2-thiouridylase